MAPTLLPHLVVTLALALMVACDDPPSGGPGAGGTAGSTGQAGSSGSSGKYTDDPGNCSSPEHCPEVPSGGPYRPPPKSGGGLADGEAPVLHGVSKLYLGDTDRQGNPSADAWKELGFDIDGWVSTIKQTPHCKAQPGGKSAFIQVDGLRGIDNSFGANIVHGILDTILSDASLQATAALTQGESGLVLDLGRLGAAASYNSTPSQIFVVEGLKSGNLFLPPGDDWSAYAWRPRSDAVEADGQAKIKLPGAYLTGNSWVSGVPAVLPLRLSLQGFPLVLPLRLAQLSLDVTDRQHGVGGTLGGVLWADEFAPLFADFASHLATSLCVEGNRQAILDAVKRASDILADGTQDPGKNCDAISLGLGFETRATSLGETAGASPDQKPCSP